MEKFFKNKFIIPNADLIQQLNCDVVIGRSRDFDELVPTKRNVIFFWVDNHGSGDARFFLPKDQRPKTFVEKIHDKLNQFPETNFHIVTTSINFSNFFQNIPNLKVTYWVDEMFFNFLCDYSLTVPQEIKNFESPKHWIALFNNKRWPRYIASMYLLGKGAESTGVIKLDPSYLDIHNSWDSFLSYWEYNDCMDIFDIKSSFPILSQGFDKIKQRQGVEFRPYTDFPAIGNSENFDQHLRLFYQNSVVEIIAETIFMQQSGIITEKFLQSVYGFNFPIILNVPGAVSRLRSIGFDMFDDVIDHSHDTIQPPMIRLIAALENNLPLLMNAEHARKSWTKCKSRFQQNVILAKELEKSVPQKFIEIITNSF
jgi:hypothetical protein